MVQTACYFAHADTIYSIRYFIFSSISHRSLQEKLVSENLRKAFPDKTDKELKQLEQKFYHHFCDYIVETIKLMHISDEEMRRRMKFEQVEIIDRLFAENRSIIILLGHFGNWEWVPSVTLWTHTPDVMFAQIYRPLKNKWFDRFFLKLRSRFGSVCIAKQDTLRAILQMKRSGKPSITGFMSDQTPSPKNIHHWARFLSQDSPVLTGFEKIARKTDFAVLYFDVEIVKRGYYKTTIREIALRPNELPEFEITDRYTAIMEKRFSGIRGHGCGPTNVGNTNTRIFPVLDMKKSLSLYSTGTERIYCVNFFLRYVPIPMPI